MHEQCECVMLNGILTMFARLVPFLMPEISTDTSSLLNGILNAPVAPIMLGTHRAAL